MMDAERYAPHLMLKEIGGPGQQRLSAACIALVGAGGLGAPAALYLAAAGVGRLRLIDHDTVALSNLQRQVIYREADIGAAKVTRAAAALRALNASIKIDARAERLDEANARALLAGASIVLDGSDDFATRFAVNAACHGLGLALISGAVGQWQGQVATFKSGLTKHLPPAKRLPCYRCFVPEAPPGAMPCEREGIAGPLTGVIGSMLALEAVKEITQAGESLAGKLMVYDSLKGAVRTALLRRDPACRMCGSE